MLKNPNPCDDTIVATATPPGHGGVAIVRVSGPLTQTIATHLLKKIPSPRYATYSSFFSSQGEILDQGIALFFPHPHSFTGDDILELHGHGSPVVTDRLVQEIIHLGARLARPGEFSLRAFLNDKMDLVQAEAIADLIHASSEQAARYAMRSLQGEFSKKIHALVERVIHLRMYVEAAIDFVEEEIDFLNNEEIASQLNQLINDLYLIRNAATEGSIMREGITAVIAGQPNVGKSSLLNQLSGKETAIVTSIPGTTRDVLREHILMDGLPIHIIDTAGLRESEDSVEQEGIRRAREEILRADIILFVTDVNHHDENFFNDFLTQMPQKAELIIIKNKIDLTKSTPSLVQENKKTIISLSAKTSQGIDLLKQYIKKCAGLTMHTENIFFARRRHLDALSKAHSFLLNGQVQLHEYKAGELLAEDLRQAQHALNEITGEFTTDDLLGKIFGSFCVGK